MNQMKPELTEKNMRTKDCGCHFEGHGKYTVVPCDYHKSMCPSFFARDWNARMEALKK